MRQKSAKLLATISLVAAATGVVAAIALARDNHTGGCDHIRYGAFRANAKLYRVHNPGDPAVRQRVARQIVRCDALRRSTRPRVYELLGKPDMPSKNVADWDLGAPSPAALDNQVLSVIWLGTSRYPTTVKIGST